MMCATVFLSIVKSCLAAIRFDLRAVPKWLFYSSCAPVSEKQGCEGKILDTKSLSLLSSFPSCYKNNQEFVARTTSDEIRHHIFKSIGIKIVTRLFLWLRHQTAL